MQEIKCVQMGAKQSSIRGEKDEWCVAFGEK